VDSEFLHATDFNVIIENNLFIAPHKVNKLK